MTPAWILDIFAAVMLAVAAVSAARLVLAQPWQQGSVITDSDIAHLLMANAMAGMLVASLATLPDHAWEVIFALMMAWFADRVIRDARANGVRVLAGAHCAPHLVHSAAMLYMFLAITAPGSGGPGMRTLSYPTLALAFGLVLAGYGVWDLDLLSGARHAFAAAPAALARPHLATMPALAATQPAAFTGAVAADSQQTADPVPAVSPARAAYSAAFLMSPGVTVSCRIAMSVTMALMLFLMI